MVRPTCGQPHTATLPEETAAVPPGQPTEIDQEEQDRRPARAGLRRRAEDAARKTLLAEKEARVADLIATYDPTGARFMRRDAERLDETATALFHLDHPPARGGTGGELAVTGAIAAELPGLVEPVAEPNVVEVEASLTRLELAAEAGGGVLGLALDAAHGAGAATPVERMLCHQLGAAHGMAMRLAARADDHLREGHDRRPLALRQAHAAEAARLAGASARVMEAFARGALALDRLRQGGARQVVEVRHEHRHLHLSDGGRATVADEITAAGGSREGGAAEK